MKLPYRYAFTSMSFLMEHIKKERNENVPFYGLRAGLYLKNESCGSFPKYLNIALADFCCYVA